MARDPRETKPRTKRDARQDAETSQRKTRRTNRGDAAPAQWSDADPLCVLAAIAAVAERGCAIQFGYTRDGGAFVVRIVGDGEPYNEFVRPTEDVNLYLRGLHDDFTNGNAGEPK